MQVVDDYLKLNGYFTTHNIGFPPSLARPDIAPASSILSDVDVVATTRASS